MTRVKQFDSDDLINNLRIREPGPVEITKNNEDIVVVCLS